MTLVVVGDLMIFGSSEGVVVNVGSYKSQPGADEMSYIQKNSRLAVASDIESILIPHVQLDSSIGGLVAQPRDLPPRVDLSYHGSIIGYLHTSYTYVVGTCRY